MPSTPLSPRGVAVDRTGAKGGDDETPSGVERESRVGLGGPLLALLPTGCSPGDAGLAKESICIRRFSTAIENEQRERPINLGLQDLLRELQGCKLV